MSETGADHPLTSEELEKHFGPAEPIHDELIAHPGDSPVVEPMAASSPADSRPLTRAVWFFGFAVLAMVGVQTAQMALPKPAQNVPVLEPGGRSGNSGETRMPADQIWSTLRDMRVQLSRAQYEQVVRLLEPLTKDPGLLDSDQRFEAYLLLAKAHRALHNVDKAQEYSLRATDQMVDRREPAQVLEHSRTLADQGRHEESRRELFKLIARRDGVPQNVLPFVDHAEARLGDVWYGQAIRTGHVAPLPGAGESESRPAEPATAEHK